MPHILYKAVVKDIKANTTTKDEILSIMFTEEMRRLVGKKITVYRKGIKRNWFYGYEKNARKDYHFLFHRTWLENPK